MLNYNSLVSYGKAVNIIKRAGRVLILCHKNPDGDCIGSQLSLGLALIKAGKKVRMLRQEPFPSKYLSLPGAAFLSSSVPASNELAVSVDCGSEQLLGDSAGIFRNSRHTLSIDHHQFWTPFAESTLNDAKSPATGEIIYKIIKKLGIQIDRDIAQNILTAIIVETNSFRLPATRKLTFRICAEMMKTGVDYYRVSQMVYWVKNRNTIKLLKLFYSKMKLAAGNRIAYVHFRISDFLKTGAKPEESDMFAEEMRSIDFVRVSAYFREISRKSIRVSLRSKDGINVAEFAEKYGGGGHHDSAGMVVSNDRKEIRAILSGLEKLV